MPQASEEDRNRAVELFGSILDEDAIGWLVSRGWTLTHGFSWIHPDEDHVITEDELFAISFLIDEWDFAGLVHRLKWE